MLTKEGWKPDEGSTEAAEQFIEEFEEANKEVGNWSQQEPDRAVMKEKMVADEFINQLNLGHVKTADEFTSIMIAKNPRVSYEFAKYQSTLRNMEENYYRSKCIDQTRVSLKELLS